MNQYQYKSIEEYNQPQEWTAQHVNHSKSHNQSNTSEHISTSKQYIIKLKQIKNNLIIIQSQQSISWNIKGIKKLIFFTLIRVISIMIFTNFIYDNKQIDKYLSKHVQLLYGNTVISGILYLLIVHSQLGRNAPINFMLGVLSSVSLSFLLSFVIKRNGIDFQPAINSIVVILIIFVSIIKCGYLRRNVQNIRSGCVCMTILSICGCLIFGINEWNVVLLMISLIGIIMCQIIQFSKVLDQSKNNNINCSVIGSQVFIMIFFIIQIIIIFLMVEIKTFNFGKTQIEL